MGSLSIWHWLIVLLIVMLVFGTKKLGNIGSDLGKAMKGFKDGVRGAEESAETQSAGKAQPQVADKSAMHAATGATTEAAIDVEAKEKTQR